MRKKIRAALLIALLLVALFVVAAETAYATGPHQHVSAKAVLIPLAACALLQLVVLALFRRRQPRQPSRGRGQQSAGYSYPQW